MGSEGSIHRRSRATNGESCGRVRTQTSRNGGLYNKTDDISGAGSPPARWARSGEAVSMAGRSVGDKLLPTMPRPRCAPKIRKVSAALAALEAVSLGTVTVSGGGRR